jgi:predicted component of type VI protein secretion system
MPAQLVALNDGPNILLDKPILLIGRHQECDIQIDARKISRRHCCIAQVGDELVVRDLGSTNGIRINGVRVVEGRLKAGDELTIGNHRFQLRWDSTSSSHLGLNKAPPKKPAGPAAARPVSEQAMESWDEPVPLAEPAETPPKLPAAKPPAPPTQAPGEPHEHHTADSATEQPAGPGTVPEDLELAPASDEALKLKNKREPGEPHEGPGS